MSDHLTITRPQLAAALKQWETDAAENRWPDRDDDARFDDNAEYLFGLLAKAG